VRRFRVRFRHGKNRWKREASRGSPFESGDQPGTVSYSDEKDDEECRVNCDLQNRFQRFHRLIIWCESVQLPNK